MWEPDSDWLRRFRRNLARWYNGHARDLPWRQTRDAYAIWVSEIMLQQTTVAAVVPYFERFLARFPTVHDLAAAPESEVLRYWEGLGYYSRARNLRKTAQRLVAEHDGRFPQRPDELSEFPGIGRYTAGAIASFAFDTRAAILEANTTRLFCRLLGFQGDPRSTAGQRLLWDFAQRILPRQRSGLFNQALMELGATVCKIDDPECQTCPVRTCCRACSSNLQGMIPVRVARRAVTELTEASIAIRNNGHVLLEQRQPGEWWAGLWDFPRLRLDGEIQASSLKARKASASDDLPCSRKLASDIQRRLAATTGVRVDVIRMLSELRHTVTRYRIRLLCLVAEYRDGEPSAARSQRWVPVSDLGDYPLSTTGRKLAKMVSGEASRRSVQGPRV